MKDVEPKKHYMKFSRIHLGAATLGMVLLVSSSAVTNPHVGQSLAIGEHLPEMNQAVEQGMGLLPKPSSGRYTLVHFWASYDAESRAEHVRLSEYFGQTVSDKIAYRAISIDPDRAVYDATLKLDQLDPERQYCAADERQQVISQYRLAHGLRTYLVDDSGVVLSVDPSLQDLERIYSL